MCIGDKSAGWGLSVGEKGRITGWERCLKDDSSESIDGSRYLDIYQEGGAVQMALCGNSSHGAKGRWRGIRCEISCFTRIVERHMDFKEVRTNRFLSVAAV